MADPTPKLDPPKKPAEPIPVTIVQPGLTAPEPPPQPDPVDPKLKTPENQINVPAPMPTDPRAYYGPDSAVPVGEEHKTPAAQQRAAEKVFAGEDPQLPDDPKAKKK